MGAGLVVLARRFRGIARRRRSSSRSSTAAGGGTASLPSGSGSLCRARASASSSGSRSSPSAPSWKARPSTCSRESRRSLAAAAARLDDLLDATTGPLDPHRPRRHGRRRRSPSGSAFGLGARRLRRCPPRRCRDRAASSSATTEKSSPIVSRSCSALVGLALALGARLSRSTAARIALDLRRVLHGRRARSCSSSPAGCSRRASSELARGRSDRPRTRLDPLGRVRSLLAAPTLVAVLPAARGREAAQPA